MQHLIESLEPRRLKAGLITIDTTGPTVVVTGDGADNFLSVDETDPAGDGTPSGGFSFGIYGGPPGGALYVDGVENTGYFTLAQEQALRDKPWKIDLGDGDDYLDVARYEDSIRSLSVRLGNGNDSFSVDSRFYPANIGAVHVDGGAGEDTISIGNIGGNVSVLPGPGRDRVLIAGDNVANGDPRFRVRLLGKLQILDTQGPTRVVIDYADVRRGTSIVTGNSIDRVAIRNVAFSGQFTMATHGGNDILANTDCHFRRGVTVAPGAGRDEVNGFDDWI
ncbi:MAG: hypothetical protein JWM57_3834 [Phycisphaerales bacterium]|nr:hypothetical protein [Phycisphaerales bacterium]